MIVATTHGSGGTSNPFGRGCMRVVHDATVPVAVIGEGTGSAGD